MASDRLIVRRACTAVFFIATFNILYNAKSLERQIPALGTDPSPNFQDQDTRRDCTTPTVGHTQNVWRKIYNVWWSHLNESCRRQQYLPGGYHHYLNVLSASPAYLRLVICWGGGWTNHGATNSPTTLRDVSASFPLRARQKYSPSSPALTSLMTSVCTWLSWPWPARKRNFSFSVSILRSLLSSAL